MKKQDIKEWLEGAVADSFMNLLYYDRKECEYIGHQQLRDWMDDGTIPKEMLVEIFLKQIDKEY